MPGVHEARGNVGAASEHEACKVCDGFVVENINCREDDETDEGDAQRSHDMKCAFAKVVRALADREEDDKADSIGCHSPKIRLDDAIAESLDDLGQKVRSRSKCNRIGKSDYTPREHLPGFPLPEHGFYVEVVGS